VLCRNNAETYGIYPRKGAIRVGSDTDFALVDLDRERVVTAQYMQSAADWGLYDGWNLKGWPTTTIVRGEVVMQDGRIVGSPEHGQYIVRRPA
jgi:dihydropyrimidinase